MNERRLRSAGDRQMVRRQMVRRVAQTDAPLSYLCSAVSVRVIVVRVIVCWQAAEELLATTA